MTQLCRFQSKLKTNLDQLMIELHQKKEEAKLNDQIFEQVR